MTSSRALVDQPPGGREHVHHAHRVPTTMSVVICTRDRPHSLLACVRSLATQKSMPGELIVVDDGQLAPQHREYMADLCAGAGMRFVCLQKDVPGLPASRNLAVRYVQSDVVQFLDDDVVLGPDFCGQVLRLYDLDDAGAVVGVGGTLVDSRPSLTARGFALCYRLAGWWALNPKSVQHRPLPRSLRDPRWVVPVWLLSGACMSFRRAVLLRNHFDEGLAGYALGEDRDMSLRLAREGRLLRSRGAVAIHHHDPAGRPNHYQFGRMVVLNYLRIMRRIGRTSIGDSMVIGYSFAVILSVLACCSVLRPQRYAPELRGMIAGLLEHLRSRL